MRRTDWLKAIQEQAMKDRLLERKGLWQPGARVTPNWPVCMTCGRHPHAVNLEDEGSGRLEIRVKCTHMSNPPPSAPEYEDSVRVNIPTGLSEAAYEQQVGWALKNVKVFDPSRPPK